MERLVCYIVANIVTVESLIKGCHFGSFNIKTVPFQWLPCLFVHSTVQPQLSQLTEPLWNNPGLKSEISVRELISTVKKRAGEE